MIQSLKLVSLGIAPLAIISAAAVVWTYRGCMRMMPSNATQFLIAGIVIGFAGKLADNIVWTGIWATQQVSPEIFPQLADIGSVINIATRQIPLIVSAACHLHAARLMAAPPCIR